MPLNNTQRLRVEKSEVESSCPGSHTRQKPKRGEDLFNAKIARIKWKKGLSVTCGYLNQELLQYNPEHQAWSCVTFNMSFTLLLLWKRGSVMMHGISQSLYQPGLNLASERESGFEMLAIPDQGLSVLQPGHQPLHHIMCSPDYCSGDLMYNVHSFLYYATSRYGRGTSLVPDGIYSIMQSC